MGVRLHSFFGLEVWYRSKHSSDSRPILCGLGVCGTDVSMASWCRIRWPVRRDVSKKEQKVRNNWPATACGALYTALLYQVQRPLHYTQRCYRVQRHVTQRNDVCYDFLALNYITPTIRVYPFHPQSRRTMRAAEESSFSKNLRQQSSKGA